MKKICVLSFLLVFLTSIAFAGTVNLPKTGQTKCWDEYGTEVPCAGTGQDGDIRAGVEWPEPRFTDNSDGTMTDNLTGLMWTKNGNLPGREKRWQEAMDYVAGMNLGTYPNYGYTDWRLPNVNELESPINADEADSTTWLNSQGFTNVQFGYWSSTNYLSTFAAWFVGMNAGGTGGAEKSYYGYVWPVRSGKVGAISLPKTGQKKCYDSSGKQIFCAGTGQDGDIQAGTDWPILRFTGHENGMVTDNLTGIMWAKNANLPNGYKTWQEALDYITGMNSGTHYNFGYTDWRLPNMNELHSLIDFSQYDPALPAGNPFTNLQANGYDGYLSSTTYANHPDYACVINMWTGGMGVEEKSSMGYYYVWPVRGGQIQSSGCSAWADVVAKYQAYKNGQATLRDVIDCFREWRKNAMDE